MANIQKHGKITIEQLEKHIKTHTECSDDDRSAVTMLKMFLRSGGRINANFDENDKWPNTDGTFELVSDPAISRKPKQNFVVQIKGTSSATLSADGTVKYQLKTLAFPAYIAKEVTLDPGILFLVLNPSERGKERVFWKYMSPKFIASIDFDNDSKTIDFLPEDEIENTDASVNEFVHELDHIADTHSYIKQLSSREYVQDDVKKLVIARCQDISDAIETSTVLNYTRDQLSRRMLTALEDLCTGTLMLNALIHYQRTNIRVAWELALTSIKTKFLSTFLQGLRYISLRVPDDGQYERLMLKYYSFLWRMRHYLAEVHNLAVLDNLGDFPLGTNEEDREYNRVLAAAIDAVGNEHNAIRQNNRYFIHNKIPFYVEDKRYFEITLQLADKFATKYNRLTVYSEIDISSNYSIQIGYEEVEIQLWENKSKIKVVTDWSVSIAPQALNKLSKIIKSDAVLSSRYNEYSSLMNYLTRTGINLLDLIDMSDERFEGLLSQIYNGVSTQYFKDVIVTLHERFNEKSAIIGRNTVRYALIRLREELLEDVLPVNHENALINSPAYLTKQCYPFERNPILYNLPNRKTNGKVISSDVLRTIGTTKTSEFLPYIRIKHLIDQTGELYFPKEELEYKSGGQTISAYNARLGGWDKDQGYELKEEKGYVYLDMYVRDTVSILKYLLDKSSKGNEGQKALNQHFTSTLDTGEIDEKKISALTNIFVDSKILIIYGAAGTGKTTLMNYISDLMSGRSKLFLTKTHTALENLQRRIKAPGASSEFMGIDRFINTRSTFDYDVVFVDECSTIDNRTMLQMLLRIPADSLLVFAGDIYQIESIEFGNWFFYAKEILPQKSLIELTSTWRTQEQSIKELWEEVRFIRPLITEKLVIDGPFSENIGEAIFQRDDEDEVILCLNYDGKFGLNNINSYFQDANPSKNEFYWSEWKYKVGDPILLNYKIIVDFFLS